VLPGEPSPPDCPLCQHCSVGLVDWRAKHNMKDPVRGVFRVTGWYDAHPHSDPPGTRLTGVITAPGIPAFAAEHKVDGRGRWGGVDELPVLVDRADPSRFAIMWGEVRPVSWRDQEHARAQAEADSFNAGQAAPGPPGPDPAPADGWAPDPGAASDAGWPPDPGEASGPGWPAGPVVVSVTGDGTPGARALPPDQAAQVGAAVEAAMRQAFGAGSNVGAAVEAATGQAFGAPSAGSAQVIGAPGRAAPGTPGGGFTPDQAAQLLATGGEPASAVVIAAHDVALPPEMAAAAPGGLVDITLDITRRDGSGYTAVTRIGFSTPWRRTRVATVGTNLKVRVDPSDPARVVIDTTGLF
jgi:hypothetical protein